VATAGTAIAMLPSGSPEVIALLLPLSGRQQAAGLAVQDGFLAAALAEAPERRPRIDVYDTAALGAGPAYQKALATGAQAVAGPLIKEELASLVASQPLPLPTLALNALGSDTPPAFLFQFALDPEQEARAAARCSGAAACFPPPIRACPCAIRETPSSTSPPRARSTPPNSAKSSMPCAT
jgi:outer membrane PBP1 activator LpoA protein